MSTISRLHVALDARGYDIIIGSRLLGRAHEYMVPLLGTKRAIIVSDTTVASIYAVSLISNLAAQGIHIELVTVAAGEESKSFGVLESLMEQLLALTPDRKTTLIALGGGVIGDLTGFAASILMRGVPFIQIPTTLLAQVDSSVGGKTAINTAAGKNLVGSFYQPKLVLADLDTLGTLPARELRAGYAEIIKYGLIMDAGFYHWCLDNATTMLAGEVNLQQHAVHESCRMKAAVVKADEREADMRALLNFGHTFAHALEAETGYGQKLNHGEAVAIGMVMACRLSASMGLIAESVEEELAAHFKAVGLPAHPRDVQHTWSVAGITQHFVRDKKAENGALTFVVLDAIGKARVVKGVDAALAKQVVTDCLKI